MGVGILSSRRQANLEMALAEQRGRQDCCGKTPSNPQGGVTGSTPQTGTRPNTPYARQSQLHPRAPQGQIARLTGNTPCGSDSSQNFEQQGHTGNPADQQPALENLINNPVSPYQPNPLEMGDMRRCCPRKPAVSVALGQGGYTNPSSAGSPSPAYQQGYREGVSRFNQGDTDVGDDRSEVPSAIGAGSPAGDDYMQGLFDGVNEGGTDSPAPGYEFTYNPQGRSTTPGAYAGGSHALYLTRPHTGRPTGGNIRAGVNRRGAAGY